MTHNVFLGNVTTVWTKRCLVAALTVSILGLPTAPVGFAQTATLPAPSAASMATAGTQIQAQGVTGVPALFTALPESLRTAMPYAAAAGLAVSAYLFFSCMGKKKDGKPKCNGTGQAVAAIGAVLSVGALVGSLNWNSQINTAQTGIARTLDQGMNGTPVAATAAGAVVQQGAAARPAATARPGVARMPAAGQAAVRLDPATGFGIQGVSVGNDVINNTYGPSQETFRPVSTAPIGQAEGVRLTPETGFDARFNERAAAGVDDARLQNSFLVGREVRDGMAINNPAVSIGDGMARAAAERAAAQDVQRSNCAEGNCVTRFPVTPDTGRLQNGGAAQPAAEVGGGAAPPRGTTGGAALGALGRILTPVAPQTPPTSQPVPTLTPGPATPSNTCDPTRSCVGMSALACTLHRGC